MSGERCRACHGIRLIGWSGAGPHFCRECSKDVTTLEAFEVITAAWREQWARVEELSALVRKMDADYAASRVGIMALHGELHEHLALMVRYLNEETSSGDGIADCHVDGYEAAKSLLVRSAPNQPSWENAQIEVADLLRKSSEVPGLSAELDRVRWERDRAVRLLNMLDRADARHPDVAAFLDGLDAGAPS